MCHLFQLLKLLQREAKVKFVYFFWFLNDFQIRFIKIYFYNDKIQIDKRLVTN